MTIPVVPVPDKLGWRENAAMVFDVKSYGLHGEGFAFGWVVVDLDTGEKHPDEGLFWCEPDIAKKHCRQKGNSALEWVNEHIDPLLMDWSARQPACRNPEVVRTKFWGIWRAWSKNGATLWADCQWPVEARFIAACVDDFESRDWNGPYPFHEIATMRLAAGLDPLAEEERLPDELPKHNPLADARQSARLLVEAWRIVKAKREAKT